MYNGYSFDRLFLPPQQLSAFAANHPTPFFLYDAAGLRQSAQELHSAFSWCPNCRHFYCLRANDNPALLRLFQASDLGAMVTSTEELHLAVRCGFAPADIVFYAPVITDEAMVQIHQTGCQIIFDSLAQVERFAAADWLPETAGLRYNPGQRFKISGLAVSRPECSQFGMTEPELFQAVSCLWASGVSKIGLHAHLVSQTLEEEYLAALCEILLHLSLRLLDRTGIPPVYCDLSGGIGLADEPGAAAPDLVHMARRVRRVCDALLPGSGLEQLQLRTQLGRCLVGRHGVLVSRVAEIRQRQRPILLLDACACDLLRGDRHNAYHHISLLEKPADSPRRMYDVAGMTADHTDFFARSRLLPTAAPGDLCVLHAAGAYTGAGGRCAEYLYGADGSISPTCRTDE